MIYLDFAATTPMSDEALAVFTKIARHVYGNASSLHDIGSSADNLLEAAREEIAKLLHGETNGIYFTSGGSESNILALQSLLEANREKGNHVITTRCEHASVYNLFRKWEQSGLSVTYLPLNGQGEVDTEALIQAIRPDTILASIQYVNSEIGTIQPIAQIGEILHERDVIFHCDAVQAFGKLPIDVRRLRIDALSVSSHKIYGPKGVGAVYINPRRKWMAQFPGTTHENGFRPGTVNVPGIAAFTAAAQAIYNTMDEERERLHCLRDTLIRELQNIPHAQVVQEGDPRRTLPAIAGLRIVGLEGQLAMLECNRYGVAISTGSACAVGSQEPSRTMKAMGRSDEEAKQFIRLSFGKTTTKEDVLRAAAVLRSIAEAYFG